jgi:DUF2971 family protein
MALYRYLTFEAGVATLKNATLKLTPPIDFNDPFDMKPAWNVTLTDAEMRRAYTETGLEKKISFAEFVEYAQPSSPVTQLAGMKSFEHHLNKLWGAICFSRISDSIPMWAYYCGNHTGLVIEFDEAEENFEIQFLGRIKEVEYTVQRPAFTSLTGNDIHMFYVKADGWKHEAECRILYRLENLDVVKTFINQRPAWLVPFSKASVKSVILGCRVSEAHQSIICHSLQSWGYSSVKVTKMIPDAHEYHLKAHDCGCSHPNS